MSRSRGRTQEEKTSKKNSRLAPGEDRTHDLQIMRLTRYLLRYRGGREHSRFAPTQLVHR